MLRSVKNIIWMLALLACAQSAVAWTPIGPPAPANTSDDWMTPTIGYNIGNSEGGTPKTPQESYRRNIPVVYYSFDETFWEFFGTNGVTELEKAFAMYNSIGKVSQLDINDYPEDSRRVNFTALALGLFDVKSAIMGYMSQEVGLFQPSRWVWALNGRQQLNPPVPPCPFNMEYTVYQRNYSITPIGTDNYPTVSYVNGVLYSYFIDDVCNAPANQDVADAIEFPVDPLTQPYSAVADYSSLEYAGLLTGTFYTMLTRDDVAGMKYLYNTNTLHREAAGGRVTEFVTNDISQAQVVTTQDLGTLAAASRTSTAAQLQAQFPGLTVLSTSNYFGLQITTNITETLVNSPLDPAGAPASHPFFTTNYTTNVVQFFTHTFGNIITNSYATVGIVGTVNQTISNSPFAPAGSPPVTNTTVRLTPAAGVFGDFFILPNGVCSAVVLSNFLTTVTPVTNLPTPAPSTITGNTNAVTFIPGTVTFPTNHTLLILPVTCPVNAIARRGGTDQLLFIARPYDSIVGQAWDPVTNDYVLSELDETNGVILQRHFQRRVPRPDILFSTADFAAQTTTITYSNTVDNVSETFTLTLTGVGTSLAQATFTYDQTARLGNGAGPGTIIDDDPLPKLYIFNRIAPTFDLTSATAGTTNTFLDVSEADEVPFAAWGSFDGTTNLPVVYPNGTSLQSMLDLILGPQSNTPTLPDGNIGQLYSAQLAAKSGTAPYTWSLAPNSAGLPGGLHLNANGTITGVPSGPAAIYDFTVRITDTAGKSRDVQYTISIF